MANGHENLIPMTKRTVEEQRRITSAGGRASGVSRRRKKNIKECFKFILEDGILPPKTKKKLEEMGVDPEDLSYNAALAMSMINKALQGDVQAARLILDLGISETQANEVEKDPLSAALESLGGDLDG